MEAETSRFDAIPNYSDGNSLTLNGVLNVVLINGFTLSDGDAFQFLTAGSWSGGFNGLNDGDLVTTIGGYDLRLQYGGSTSMSLVASFSAVPKPGSLLILAGACIMCGLRRRRVGQVKRITHIDYHSSPRSLIALCRGFD